MVTILKLNAGGAKMTGREFLIPPEEIIVDEALNGRKEPHTQEEIESLGRSILENQQQQAVTVRRVAGNKVQLVAGYGRVKAVRWANENLGPPQPLPVVCRVVDCNDEEAFVKNLVENHERKTTNPIDNAHNIRRLSEVYGWPDEKILGLYHRTAAWLAQMRALLSLPTPIRKEVAAKTVTVAAALDLATLPKAEQKEAIKEARKSNGQLDTEVVKNHRNKRVPKSGSGGSGKGGGKQTRQLSMKAARKFLEKFTGDDEPEPVRSFVEIVLGVIAGDVQEDEAFGRVNELFQQK